ncbi:MAG: competence protein ComK [Niallia nealsonii]|uniref:Competence protein ComK n=1 Tax=Niallia circulans TaxID=1397 RepID=A0A941GC29_NIACI|nr:MULTISPECIES: competence protein ComK [Niallia]MCB5236649.1 competence protein ComK [Niallia circulans]MDU1846137.1 competence protein ComK [Niallia nealsonii]MED3792034.1 competence protein ComK [Niallia alba]
MKENYLIVDKYCINYYTLAVLPYILTNGTIYSKVYEHDNVFLCKLSPLMIVKTTCGYLGSSYEGRRDGTRKLMTYHHKLPIVIDDFNSIYFFPTHSPRNNNCAWISLHHILDTKKIEVSKVRITFQNLQKIEVDISLYTLRNQIMRTNSLKTLQRYNHEASINPKLTYKSLLVEKQKKLAETQMMYKERKGKSDS